VGILPLKLLEYRYSPCKFCSEPNSIGILPLKLLELIDKIFKIGSEPNSAGILPLKLLELIDKIFKFGSEPNSAGISPVKSLYERSNVRNKERLPRDGERVPWRLSPLRIRATTLLV
jgi:hypothetical protein